MQKTTILGAGISGLSASYHLGHSNCEILESRPVHGGHAGSEAFMGFTLDQGPHVSFTNQNYVQELFAKNVGSDLLEFPVRTRNYFQGSWIDHPAQAHLWGVPVDIRDQCIREMLAAADAPSGISPTNYAEWLQISYGPTFSQKFPSAYTRKYWTADPQALSTDWLGPRMSRLTKDEIIAGLDPGRIQKLHYIKQVRYPAKGGFQAFFEPISKGARISYGQKVIAIDLLKKTLSTADGKCAKFERLVSTLPLPEFINSCLQATPDVREASAALDCSQLLIIDVFASHTQDVDGHWFYVYDEDKWSTRIHCVERLAPNNAPEGWTGIQVEVYFSKYRPLEQPAGEIARKVILELVEMGFLRDEDVGLGRCKVNWRWASYANVIFTHPRREALNIIWEWMRPFGLIREDDDLDAVSDWELKPEVGEISMAGRFAQWKYHWTDDCILRGKQIAQV